ncbi:MAG: hypothetical protein LLG45_12535 [Actinomycetia bacterium]|nr:hypothetical protein [Actinomycetes bacterium]
MKRYLLVVVLAALLIMGMSTAALAKPAGDAGFRASGHYVGLQYGQYHDVTFNVRVTADGIVKGSVSMMRDDGAYHVGPVVYAAKYDSTVVMVGTVADANPSYWAYFYLKVTDNGEGKNAPADTAAVAAVPADPSSWWLPWYTATPPLYYPTWEIVGGNIQVH